MSEIFDWFGKEVVRRLSNCSSPRGVRRGLKGSRTRLLDCESLARGECSEWLVPC